MTIRPEELAEIIKDRLEGAEPSDRQISNYVDGPIYDTRIDGAFNLLAIAEQVIEQTNNG